ncbi:autotransporter outer membrane beta-barrel domain-containing protein [Enterobacter bugandensis]|uniref:autotransporter outer membrane beta-barrel domain-containing protein n=1 Tax=Enterobacter bugandensis TaxID=881260 RepID=UPI0013D4D904|nr:autotransporter outer membrane beta-barrel domain-containing protein [Enterobacter bugandensis]
MKKNFAALKCSETPQNSLKEAGKSDKSSKGAFTKTLLATSVSLLLSGTAYADCVAVNNSTCSMDNTGDPGTPASGTGGSGGDGGYSGSWNLNYNGLSFIENSSDSPVNVTTTGGQGADGRDGHTSNYDGGGGGRGGDTGDINVTTGPDSTFTMTGVHSGLTIGATGGKGGGGAWGILSGLPGTSGNGGNAGNVTADISGKLIAQKASTGRAIDIWSQGGDGGDGRGWSVGQNTNAPDGGNGGNGGTVNARVAAIAQTNRAGVKIHSSGGAGGAGGDNANLDGAQGGKGGNGGNAGNVAVTVTKDANIKQMEDHDAALWVFSEGGQGGSGGTGGAGGLGGNGGNAGDVSVNLEGGNLAGAGINASPGLLVQSLGGTGGGGGTPSMFVIGPQGGNGAKGGTAGNVTITGGNANIRSGNWNVQDPTVASMAPAVLAQSIGGGGGSGSASEGWFAVGGEGGNAVNGQNVKVDISNSIITSYSANSEGIAAQSIGGGGGKGGDAISYGVGVNMGIGGSGGGGGNGGTVVVHSGDGNAVQTINNHSSGLLLQSIGGGGGAGGAAYSKSYSAGFGSSMSLGGSGGKGGNAGDVLLEYDANNNPLATNSGSIRTAGSDSYGILAQSIGGGGGVGGASTAEAQVYGGGDVPSISLTMAMGGSGGVAGNGGTVNALNTGFIQTSGSGAAGMVGQSIGGGGGAGGDASSSAEASGIKNAQAPDYSFSAAFSFGGQGGAAGDGGTSNIANNGFIVTSGESAYGMLSQSIGGGGGTGGAGDAKASAEGGKSLGLTAAVGGAGSNGGDGKYAAATNSGQIITLGDGASGVVVQSVGGGGGAGGGGAASTSGDYTLNVTVGGTGGGGGKSVLRNGEGTQVPVAQATNAKGGSILTYGADANGLVVQSIGGGGGMGGKAGTSLGTDTSSGDGGSGDSQTISKVITAIQTALSTSGMSALDPYKGVSGGLDLVNQLLGKGLLSRAAEEDPESALNDTAEGKGENEDENESTKISLSVAVGGKAGSGGQGGYVTANNNGDIATLGHQSDAILAQSIGGGGGKGGGASSAASNDYAGAISVGGKGGDGGYAGTVQVTNTGSIYTAGALAAGIVAESISGGGGEGGASATSVKTDSKNNKDANDGFFKSVSVSLGGDGGSSYSSGQAMVNSSGLIRTVAHDAIGIIAQSIAGGGGILKTIATDLEGAGGTASTKGTDHDLQFSFGGQNGETVSSGYGSGLVAVTTQKGGAISTNGDNSYGILAQSISGGGGVQLGGDVEGSTVNDFFGTGKKTGNVNDDGKNDQSNWANNSGVFVNTADNIVTAGQGAIGIVAQSIGGGGGLAGNTGAIASVHDSDPSNTAKFLSFTGGKGQFSGSGGYVGVNVGQDSTIATTGINAPAIFAQSVGGGGGRVTNENGAYFGSAGGSGTGGTVNVNVDGKVITTGMGSAGIIAQSDGDSSSNSPVNVTVGSTGLVQVGQEHVATGVDGTSAAIYISKGAKVQDNPASQTVENTVTNNGSILTFGSNRNAVAVYSTGGYTKVINNGTMWGDVLLQNGGGTGCFTNNGTLNAGDKISVGNCGLTNNGTMVIGADHTTGTVTVDGNYNGKGTLAIDADFVSGKSDKLQVNGNATFNDTVEVNATKLKKDTSVEIAQATGAMKYDNLNVKRGGMFHYDVTSTGNNLVLTPKSDIISSAANFGANRKAVANDLQTLWDNGHEFDTGFAALAKVGQNDVGKTLDTVSGQALGLIGASRYQASLGFVDTFWSSCDALQQASGSCAWGKYVADNGRMDNSRDAMGYKTNSNGMQFGASTAINDNTSLGFSVAVNSLSANDSNNIGSVSGRSGLAAAYANWESGAWRLGGAVDLGYGTFDTSRHIELGDYSDIAKGSTSSWNAGVHTRAGWRYAGSMGWLEPRLDLSLIHVETKGFDEKGDSPFNLSVEDTSDTSLVATPAIALGKDFSLKNGSQVKLFTDVGYTMMSDDSWTPKAHIAGSNSSFSANTPVPNHMFKTGVGVEYAPTKDLSFSAIGNGDFGSHYDNKVAEFKVTYGF